MQPSGTKSTPNTMQLRKLFATDSISSILGHLVSLVMRYNRISKIITIFLQLMSQLFRAELSLDQILVEYPNFCPTIVQPKETKWPWFYAIRTSKYWLVLFWHLYRELKIILASQKSNFSIEIREEWDQENFLSLRHWRSQPTRHQVERNILG